MNLGRTRILAVAVVALVLLAGCAGAGGGDGAEASGGPAAQSGGDAGGGDGGSGGDTSLDFDAEGDGGDAAASSGASAAIQNRAIIKTGRVHIEVDNATATRTRLESRVAELGGYVSASDSTRHQENNET